jgi:hypothetical protein
MANIQNELDDTLKTSSEGDTTNPTTTSADAQNNAVNKLKNAKTSGGNALNQALSEAIGHLAFRSNDVASLTQDVRTILRTISAMNQAKETSIGITVDGQLYRFTDYKLPSFFSNLVGPAKVVASDVVTAIDFLDRKRYADPGDILDPAEMQIKLKEVFKKLRINPACDPVSRDSLWLISEATKYAVTNGKVVDSKQSKFVYLNTKFDNEAEYSVRQWANHYASTYVE